MAASLPSSADQGGPGHDGVVVHLDEEGAAKHEAVIRNLRNLLAELGGQVTVELVAHGPGIGVCLADGPCADDLRDLIGRGLTVAACENTLERQGIGRDRLVDRVATVPSGIAELVRRQQQGWAYVRP